MPALLPPLLPVPTSAETRLAYVLRHLRLAYPELPDIGIGYATGKPRVEVADAAAGFFEQQQPYPAEPNWREWSGLSIPFFFDPHPERPLLELLPNGRALIHADLISAAFYLLSGWQEYYAAERDQHGRFPYSASVQKRYGFVAIPVVNHYFDVLKMAVELVTGQLLHRRRWAGTATFAACITHDIDNLYSAWKAPAKAALLRRDWLRFGRQLWRHFTQKDAWDNVQEVQQTVANYGAKSTFFFLPEHEPGPDGTPNADYKRPAAWARINRLRKTGAEIGLHASLLAADPLWLEDEAGQVASGAAGVGIRFHYLRWEPRTALTMVAKAGFAYDSTLGFAEHFGFRHSYCRPFYLFDFSRNEAVRFLELPLNVMDTTLHHPRYLQLAPEEVLPALLPMLQAIEQFGGLCTVLWHNENFDPVNTRNGPQQFHELMRYLRSRSAVFLTGSEVSSEMVKR